MRGRTTTPPRRRERRRLKESRTPSRGSSSRRRGGRGRREGCVQGNRPRTRSLHRPRGPRSPTFATNRRGRRGARCRRALVDCRTRAGASRSLPQRAPEGSRLPSRTPTRRGSEDGSKRREGWAERGTWAIRVVWRIRALPNGERRSTGEDREGLAAPIRLSFIGRRDGNTGRSGDEGHDVGHDERQDGMHGGASSCAPRKSAPFGRDTMARFARCGVRLGLCFPCQAFFSYFPTSS